MDPRFELGFTQLGPRAFRRQVETLAKAGYRAIGSAELLTRVSGVGGRGSACADRPPAPDPRPLVFTFDDGYAALAEHAFPVLADHGFRALVFVITDYVGGANAWDVQYGWRAFSHLSWDELGRWQERGIETHAHGATHALLTWLSDAEAADELARAREAIRARLGGVPEGISYPFGAVDDRVRRLAAAAGYRLGFAGPGTARPPDPLRLPRLPVYGWDRTGQPLVLRNGVLGHVARGLARLTNACAVGTPVIQRALGRRYRDA